MSKTAVLITGTIAAAITAAVVGASRVNAQEQQPPYKGPQPSKATRATTQTELDERFAVVSSTGTLARSVGVVSAAKLTGTGNYQVIFNRNVTECVYEATIGNPGTGVAPAGQITVASRAGNVNGVFIKTYDSAGRASDRPFHLYVGC
uniref:Secreted protein n=1 Tax=Cyanothece sp. (strain PCC 7425 / ATCC 29141) TaxID=395961 RepID=B8HR20_CYAP4